MNLKAISTYVGKVLLINALFMFIALMVSVGYGVDDGFAPLIISMAITTLTGVFPLIFVRGRFTLSINESFLTIVLSWLFSFVFGSLPYIMYGGEFTVINSWFESVSGYTTTGSTILTDIEALPASILFWRSSTHDLGGLGVIVFLLIVMPDASPLKHRLTSLEISSMSRAGYRYKSGRTARIMLTVYLIMTFLETLLLWAAGMSLFDAVNHSFSTIATGGFSTHSASLMYYDSALIDVIIIFFMVLSSMHFGVLFMIFAKRSFAPLKSAVPRYYMTVIAVLSIAVTLVLMFQGGYKSFGKAALDGTFQVVSYLSTTGFGNADNASWPVLANFILLFAAFHCGCSGSTTGGIKADRVYLSLRSIRNEFARRLHPTSVYKMKVDGNPVKDDDVSAVLLYIVTYVLVILMSFCLVLACGVDIGTAFSATLSSIGNAGPGIGEVGTMGTFHFQPSLAKFVYTVDMFMGRLEIFPVLIVISLFFRRYRK